MRIKRGGELQSAGFNVLRKSSRIFNHKRDENEEKTGYGFEEEGEESVEKEATRSGAASFGSIIRKAKNAVKGFKEKISKKTSCSGGR